VTVSQELALVVEAFDRYAGVDRAVLATLDRALLDVEGGMGRFGVGQHLARMVSFRHSWLRPVSPQHARRVPDPIDMIATTWLVATSIEEPPTFFGAANVSYPARLMVPSIVHDVHHRGRITAFLRHGGRSEEERELLEDAT